MVRTVATSSDCTNVCSRAPNAAANGDSSTPSSMTRHQNQTQPWVLLRDPAEDFNRHLLLRLLRAAGEEHDLVFCDTGDFAQRDCARVVAVGLRAVVFQRAGDAHAFRRAAQ